MASDMHEWVQIIPIPIDTYIVSCARLDSQIEFSTHMRGAHQCVLVRCEKIHGHAVLSLYICDDAILSFAASGNLVTTRNENDGGKGRQDAGKPAVSACLPRPRY